MEAKKLNMTEEELEHYCNSLTEYELKRFQLEWKKNDINIWKHKLYFTITNFNFLVLLLILYAHNLYTLIPGIIICLGLIIYIIRCYNYFKGEELLYRMFEQWFHENKI